MDLDLTNPFTRAQALATGITDRQLAGSAYRQLLHGTYISAAVAPNVRHRAAAALLVHPPGAVLSHSSAARIAGAPVPHDPLEHVTVSSGADRRRRRGVRCHVAALAAEDTRALHGLRVTSAHRTFLDLAAALPLVDLVVMGDWLVRQGLTTPGALVEACSRSRLRHAGQARRAAGYVRERVDSPMETRLRMLLVLAGLPEPVVNLEIRDDFGTLVLRVDLSYPEVRLAVEYDGRQHVDLKQQWERDVERRGQVEDRGWRLLTVTSKGIYAQPEETVDRVWRALRDRGWRPLPRPHERWRPHFAH